MQMRSIKKQDKLSQRENVQDINFKSKQANMTSKSPTQNPNKNENMGENALEGESSLKSGNQSNIQTFYDKGRWNQGNTPLDSQSHLPNINKNNLLAEIKIINNNLGHSKQGKRQQKMQMSSESNKSYKFKHQGKQRVILIQEKPSRNANQQYTTTTKSLQNIVNSKFNNEQKMENSQQIEQKNEQQPENKQNHVIPQPEKCDQVQVKPYQYIISSSQADEQMYGMRGKKLLNICKSKRQKQTSQHQNSIEKSDSSRVNTGLDNQLDSNSIDNSIIQISKINQNKRFAQKRISTQQMNFTNFSQQFKEKKINNDVTKKSFQDFNDYQQSYQFKRNNMINVQSQIYSKNGRKIYLTSNDDLDGKNQDYEKTSVYKQKIIKNLSNTSTLSEVNPNKSSKNKQSQHVLRAEVGTERKRNESSILSQKIQNDQVQKNEQINQEINGEQTQLISLHLTSQKKSIGKPNDNINFKIQKEQLEHESSILSQNIELNKYQLIQNDFNNSYQVDRNTQRDKTFQFQNSQMGKMMQTGRTNLYSSNEGIGKNSRAIERKSQLNSSQQIKYCMKMNFKKEREMLAKKKDKRYTYLKNFQDKFAQKVYNDLIQMQQIENIEIDQNLMINEQDSLLQTFRNGNVSTSYTNVPIIDLSVNDETGLLKQQIKQKVYSQYVNSKLKNSRIKDQNKSQKKKYNIVEVQDDYQQQNQIKESQIRDLSEFTLIPKYANVNSPVRSQVELIYKKGTIASIIESNTQNLASTQMIDFDDSILEKGEAILLGNSIIQANKSFKKSPQINQEQNLIGINNTQNSFLQIQNSLIQITNTQEGASNSYRSALVSQIFQSSDHKENSYNHQYQNLKTEKLSSTQSFKLKNTPINMSKIDRKNSKDVQIRLEKERKTRNKENFMTENLTVLLKNSPNNSSSKKYEIAKYEICTTNSKKEDVINQNQIMSKSNSNISMSTRKVDHKLQSPSDDGMLNFNSIQNNHQSDVNQSSSNLKEDSDQFQENKLNFDQKKYKSQVLNN